MGKSHIKKMPPFEYTIHLICFKVALGVCFALKSWKEYLLLFTCLITLGKDVSFPLITNLKQTSI